MPTSSLFDTPENTKATIDLVKKYPDRFIFGTDQVVTSNWELAQKNCTT